MDKLQGARASLREENRARILKAAEAVFAETGFSGATTAAIARRAGIPKANLHYYFGTKQALYRAVLDDILALWLDAFEALRPERDPAEALTDYIRTKIYWSRTRPNASKVFANEVLHGAPELKSYLAHELKGRVESKAATFRRWAAEGRMRAIDPHHLVFLLWAATQTYADFEVQISAVLGRERLQDEDYDAAAATISGLVLRGLGL